MAFTAILAGGPVESPGLPILFMPDPGVPGSWRVVSFGVSGLITTQGYEVKDGTHDLAVRFVRGGAGASVEPCGGPATKLSFLLGADRRGWQSGLDAYDCVAVRGVWSGIDLRISGAGGRWKSEWVVASGADPSAIVLDYGSRAERDLDGGLRVETTGGVWTEASPASFQNSSSGRTEVESRYVVREARFASFEVGPYQRGLPLVIDPDLTFGTLLGGAGVSAATGIAVDQGGLVTIAGYTDSPEFPVASALWPRPGGTDAFVARIHPNTGRLLWATWLGGTGDDRATAVAVDQAGSVFVTGSTASTNFPVSSAVQPVIGGYRNAFLTRLGPNGDQVVFSTYYGGSISDSANALAVGASSVWIAGDAGSANLNIVGGAGALRKGSQDGFIARFSKSGALEASTFIGGVGDETVRALALDASSNVYAGGGTTSPDLALPPGSYQGGPRRGQDGFVLKLNASLSQVLAGAFLGGTRGGADGPETVNALAVDSAGNVYAGGVTQSPDFPTPSAWLGTFSGTQDGFLVKLNSSLTGAAWGTFLGGSVRDSVTSLAVGPDLAVWAAGSTTSPNFPLQSPLTASYGGSSDGFLLKMDPGGRAVPFSTFLGGAGSDGVLALAIAPSGSVYAAGQSSSTDLALRNPTLSYYGSALRAFALRIAAGTMPSVGTVMPSAGAGSSQAFTFSATHSGGTAQIASIDLLLAGSLNTHNACLVRADVASGKLALASDTDASWVPVTPGSGDVAQNSQCTLLGSGSSLTSSGVSVTAVANLGFRAPFSGARQIWASARSAAGEETGFDVRGTWTASASTGYPPVAGAVTASTSSGPSAVFTAQYSDPDGAADIATASLVVGSTSGDAGACSVRLNRSASLLLLADDSGATYRSGSPRSNGTLSNSQCVVNLAGSSFSVAGTVLTLVLDIAFQPGFAGVRNVYTGVTDSGGATAALAVRRTFNVVFSGNQPPVAVSVSPASGSGAGELFTFTFTDPNGAADIYVPRVLMNAAQSAVGGCFVAWDRPSGYIFLFDDSGSYATAVLAGSTSSTSNSQCTLNATGSRVTADGLTLTVVLNIRFSQSFLGSKYIWAEAIDSAGLASSAPRLGSYTVALQTNLAPVIGTLSPASGAGPSQRFTVTFTDANGGGDITHPRILLNASAASSTAGACYVDIDRTAGLVRLADDQGATWSSARLGTSDQVQNSQCTVSGSGTTATVSNQTLTATFDLSFRTSFTGTKNVYANAFDAGGLSSSWPLLGTFTVTSSVNQAPVAVSVSPSSASGASQAFTFVWTDANGGNDIVWTAGLVHSQQRPDGGCYFLFNKPSGTIYLADDASLAWNIAKLGSSDVVSNSQCSIRASGSSLAVSGNTVTGVADVVFRSAYNGAKFIWANATDSSGLAGAAPRLGAYTVSVPPN